MQKLLVDYITIGVVNLLLQGNMDKYKAGQILTIEGNRYRITKRDMDPCLFCELPNMCNYCSNIKGVNENQKTIPNDCCFILIE